ncbi:MAG: polynucleotidyl transferase [Synechococcus sp. CPC100]|nr:polynucleotidyl transferase [Synechococcus sp. CPC100]
MTGWLLLLSLLILGGVLSTLGDRLGSRVGKARLSLFGLRPRQTAVVITVLTGSLISALSLGLMLLVSRQLRVGLFELNDLEARLRSSRSDLKGSRNAQRQARQQLEEARADEIKARKILANAQARAGELRSTLQPLQEQTRRLEAERQRLSQDVRNRDAEIQRTDNELRAVRERISSGESELQQLEENLLALRRGDVAISSGQPLATVTLKLDRPDQARQVIDQVLREANLQAFQKVLPGQAPDRQIILVPRQDIERLEQAIRKPGTWVVLLRSAANVLRGERVVYAFPDVRPNVAITMEGEVLAKTTLASQDTNPEAVRNRINLLLASTLAEVRRRGSLSQGLQFDANAVNTLARELTERSGGLVELEAVAAQRSETADAIAVELRPSRRLRPTSTLQDEIP